LGFQALEKTPAPFYEDEKGLAFFLVLIYICIECVGMEVITDIREKRKLVKHTIKSRSKVRHLYNRGYEARVKIKIKFKCNILQAVILVI
jgi:hypothetical protein